MLIVPLFRAEGRFTLVDEEDVEWANANPPKYHTRCPRRRRIGAGRGYAGTRAAPMHRAIAARMGLVGNIDHLNGWGLDNRRCNLRAASNTEIARSGHRPNVHKFCCLERRQAGLPTRWRAQFGQHYLGEFDEEAEAIEAYEAVAAERGILTARARAALLVPVIEQLDRWVAAGILVRRNGHLIEDRYRIERTQG